LRNRGICQKSQHAAKIAETSAISRISPDRIVILELFIITGCAVSEIINNAVEYRYFFAKRNVILYMGEVVLRCVVYGSETLPHGLHVHI